MKRFHRIVLPWTGRVIEDPGLPGILLISVATLIVLFGQQRPVYGSETGAPVANGADVHVRVERPNLETARFSPYDYIFRKYAGDQANNDELIAIIAATTRPESNWNAHFVGDSGHSVGLFQIHDVNGLSWNDRANPERAAAFMVPRFVDAYKQVKATVPDLSGPELASLVAAMAERPYGWSDPASPARTTYRDSYIHVTQSVGTLSS